MTKSIKPLIVSKFLFHFRCIVLLLCDTVYIYLYIFIYLYIYIWGL